MKNWKKESYIEISYTQLNDLPRDKICKQTLIDFTQGESSCTPIGLFILFPFIIKKVKYTDIISQQNPQDNFFTVQ